MLENKIEMWVIMFLLDRLLINFRLEERTLCLEIGTRTIVISTDIYSQVEKRNVRWMDMGGW